METKLITLTQENIASEHICCAIADKKSADGVKAFLSDKAFYLKFGYEICDSSNSFFELLVKRFNPNATMPRFKECVKNGMGENRVGIDIFYTAQCPFTVPYIRFLQPVINESACPVRTHQISSKEETRRHYCPITTYSVFIDGQFYTNEILTPAKLEKLIKETTK